MISKRCLDEMNRNPYQANCISLSPLSRPNHVKMNERKCLDRNLGIWFQSLTSPTTISQSYRQSLPLASLIHASLRCLRLEQKRMLVILFEEQRLFTYISAVFDLAESTSCKSQGDSNASSGEANDMRSDETVISIVPNVRLHVCNIFWTWMMGHGCELRWRGFSVSWSAGFQRHQSCSCRIWMLGVRKKGQRGLK